MIQREFGYPAGMPRRLSVPRGRLPRGTTALRPSTTQEIHWDRLAVGYAAAVPETTAVVLPLTSAEDGAVAIVGPGGEAHLAFAASLPPLGDGWTRRFVLDAPGWCTDMDLYTRDGDAVEPLPGARSHAAALLQRRYTTRDESGR